MIIKERTPEQSNWKVSNSEVEPVPPNCSRLADTNAHLHVTSMTTQTERTPDPSNRKSDRKERLQLRQTLRQHNPCIVSIVPNAPDTYLSIPGSIRPACAPTRHPELPTSQKKDESGAESHKRGIPTTNKAVYRFWGVTVLSPYVIGSGTVLSARGTSSFAARRLYLPKRLMARNPPMRKPRATSSSGLVMLTRVSGPCGIQSPRTASRRLGGRRERHSLR